MAHESYTQIAVKSFAAIGGNSKSSKNQLSIPGAAMMSGRISKLSGTDLNVHSQSSLVEKSVAKEKNSLQPKSIVMPPLTDLKKP